MDHEAHVRLVDPHAEGNRRDHHHIFAGQKRCLIARPHRRVQPRMIGQHRPTVFPVERCRQLFGQRTRLDVDDARPRVGLHDIHDLALHPIARLHRIADIGPVETGHNQPIIRQAELSQDVTARMTIRRGRQGQPGNVRKGIQQRAEQPVIAPEIMAPFGHTMRLVYREQTYLRAVEQVAEAFTTGPFGRDIEQIEIA